MDATIYLRDGGIVIVGGVMKIKCEKTKYPFYENLNFLVVEMYSRRYVTFLGDDVEGIECHAYGESYAFSSPLKPGLVIDERGADF